MKLKLHKSESGFTLIELMATIAILALIVVIAVPSIGNVINNAEEDSKAASIAMIEKAGSIADVAGLEHDNASQQQYLLTTLISEGYLDVAPDDDLVINDSYVQKVGDAGNTYEYNVAPEPTDASMFKFNAAGDTVTGFSHLRPSSLKDIVIPRDNNGVAVTSIGKSAFPFSNMTSVIIPNTVTTINEEAFRQTNLVSVTMPNSVTSIGELAFWGSNLTSVRIPNSVTSVGRQAFSDNDLRSVTLSDRLTRIEDSTFSGNKLTSVTIPDGVSYIGVNAFRINNLTTVTIPNSVAYIGKSAFASNNLIVATILNSEVTINEYVFNFNEGLTIKGSQGSTASRYKLAWHLNQSFEAIE